MGDSAAHAAEADSAVAAQGAASAGVAAAAGDLAGFYVRVTGTEDIKEGPEQFTAYVFEIRWPDGHITQSKQRYSALRDLHQQMLQLFPETMQSLGVEFPPKKPFASAAAVAKERQGQLSKFFGAAFGRRELSQSLLLRNSFGLGEGQVFYATMSVCPACALRDRAGVRWVPAEVRQSHGHVLLTAACDRHGPMSCRLCSDAAFFRRMLWPVLRISPLGDCPLIRPVGHLQSLEAVKSEAPKIKDRCAIVDIALYRQGTGYLSTEQLERAVLSANVQTAGSRTHLIRLEARTAPDIGRINSLILAALGIPCIGRRVIVEMSFDRMIAFCRLPDSAMLNPQVLPAIKYYLRHGEELLCHHELVSVMAALSCFSGIHLALTLTLDQPFPDLSIILPMLRKHNSIVRVIHLQLSRPPKDMIAAAAAGADMSEALDLTQLVTCVEAASDGDILASDYFSTAAATLLEPLSAALGWGRHCLRLAPACGAMTFLVNGASYESTPIPRLLDMDRLMETAMPILADLDISKPPSIATTNSLRKVIKAALKPELAARFPGLLAMAMDAGTAQKAKDFCAASQVLLLSRKIDFGCVDAEQLMDPLEYTSSIQQLLGTLA